MRRSTVVSLSLLQGFPDLFCDFSRYGRLVATYPWQAILGCFVIAGLSGIGLLEYRTENNAFKLWIPENSEFLANYNFLQEKFPPDTR